VTTPLLGPKQALSISEACARVNIWEGAIRSGKTIGSLVSWAMHTAQVRDQLGEVFVFGRTRDAIARNVFAPLTSVPLLRAVAPDTAYTSGAPTARLLGQTVHVLGASDRQAEEKLRGMTGKSAYGDELTVLPVAFFRQALGRLSVRDARLFGTTNPDNPGHWLRTEFLDRPRTQGRRRPRDGELDLATWHFGIDDNPHLDPDYVRNIKAEYVGLWYRRMILGHWVQAEGAIYEAFNPARHVVTELPPIERVLAAGVDYGTTNPFAAVLLAVTRDGRLVVTREFRHDSRTARRQLTDAEYSAALREWLAAGTEGQTPRWVVVDPSAESFSHQLHRDGVPGVTDADNAVLDGIRLVASLLATGRLIVHRSCTGLLDEIPGYSWDDKAAEKGEDKPIKRADHSVDALRYAVLTTRALWQRDVPLTSWTPALAA
jgi:PBSX family phage terminase large subunit